MTPQVGEPLAEWSTESVEPARMVRFARVLADPNPIHLDADVVRALGLGDRVVNQGPLNLGYVQNMLLAAAGPGGRIRALHTRYAANVYGGDRVVAGGRVTRVREPDGALLPVDCEVWLDAVRPGDPEPVRVLSGTATVLVAGPGGPQTAER